MTDVHLAVEMTFVSTPRATDEEFEAFLDEVYSQLDSIGREVSVAARLRDRVADFATSIGATSYEDAVVAFLADLRTALHAAGGGTAGWPRFEPTGRTVRELADA